MKKENTYTFLETHFLFLEAGYPGIIIQLTGNINMVPGGPAKPSAPGRPGRPGGPYENKGMRGKGMRTKR